MATNTALNRISGSDFFAILVPGSYIFFTLYVTVLSFLEEEMMSLWTMVEKLSVKLSESPVYILLILFIAYLMGSIFRAIPVGHAERMVPPFTSKFPYPSHLNHVIQKLKLDYAHSGIDDETMPDIDETDHGKHLL